MTGYGTQTRHILRGIRDLGYPVACVSWYGVEGGPLEWEGIKLFPKMVDGFGNDASPYWARRWKADLLITLIDLWVLDTNLGNMGNTRFCPLFPIDHADPLPPVIAQRFDSVYRLLTYSRYGEREVKAYAEGKYADKVRYLPHAIDCKALYPATAAEKANYRRLYYPDWPEDSFNCGMVAANKGWPSRKSFPEVMEAFARLAAKHEEARLYIHTMPGTEYGGPNLIEMANHFGIGAKLRTAHPQRFMGGDYDDEKMRQIYSTFDVLLNPSQGEGFGLAPLEAQACGVPVIVSDHSAQSELVGDGWRVSPLRLTPSMIWGKYAQADVEGIYHALEECYRRPKSPHFAAVAREFALQYHHEVIIPAHWGPFLAEMDGGRSRLARELEAITA